jgi:NYN domain
LDRCALFVDAGYALGDGAQAVHGTRHRDSVSWDHAGLLKLLGGLARDRTGLPLLRCYWYDVAAAGSRAAEHDSLADVPGVKLRLSKARPSRKEGVEAEMRKDLTALARNHAVTDVIIVSAEEDLAPAIAEVQEFGVRAVLLHIAADGSWAGSRALRQECDDVIEVSAGHLRPFAELVVGAEPQPRVTPYGEQLASSGALGAPPPVPDSSAPRLFASPVPAGYERATQLTAAGQSEDQRDLVASADAARLSAARQGDLRQPGSIQPAPDVQPAQQPPTQLAPAAAYQHSAEALGAGRPAVGEAGFGQAAFSDQSATLAANGHGASGQQLSQPPGPDSAGAQAIGNGLVADRLPAPAAGGVPGTGVPAGGMSTNGLPAMSPEAPNGIPAGGVRPALPHSGVAPGGLGQAGPAPGQIGAGAGVPDQQQGFLPAPPSVASPQHVAQPPQSMSQHQLAPPQPGFGQQPMAQPGQGLAMQPGAHRQTGVPGGPQGQNGQMPLDPQRPQLPGRQLSAGNSLPYGQESRMPYAGQLQQPQFGGSAEQPYAPAGYGGQPAPAGYGGQPAPAGYGGQPAPAGYGGQPAQLPAPALSVGDAVQSAHAEGFGFGEAVARDAPALWLEAVLARKPRMPSDLEARLLQGSALPIDSLLHDEVRHALRRGFWDALERSRH